MDHPKAEFDAHEMQLLENARRESEAADAAALAEAAAREQAEQGGAAAPAAPAPAPVAAPAAPAPAPAAAPAAEAPAPAPAAAAPAAPAAPAPEAAPAPQGDLRGALRASRRAEHRARQEAEELRKRLEAAGIDPNAPATAAPKPPADELRDVSETAPKVAQYIQHLERQVAQAPAPAPRTEFVPEALDPEVQDAVDTVPQLLTWQTSADHRKHWEAAKEYDRYLRKLPAWQNRPLEQRLAAVAEKVAHDIASAAPSPSPPAPPSGSQIVQQVLASAPAVGAPAVAIGDLRGGSSPSTQTPDYHRMVREGLTDEQIMAKLPVMP